MIRAEDVALILLAAGRSRRFGATDKLAALLAGKPMAFHVVDTLNAVPFAARIAVVSGTNVDFQARGFQSVINSEPDRGIGRSLHFGARTALDTDAVALIVVLADMPFVTAQHVSRLLEQGQGSSTVVVSSDGTSLSPPALFGRAHFKRLMELDGDSGARDLVAGASRVITTTGELADIDTADDLAAARQRNLWKSAGP